MAYITEEKRKLLQQCMDRAVAEKECAGVGVLILQDGRIDLCEPVGNYISSFRHQQLCWRKRNAAWMVIRNDADENPFESGRAGLFSTLRDYGTGPLTRKLRNIVFS